jgi:Protein of unknown function (DUF2608)
MKIRLAHLILYTFLCAAQAFGVIYETSDLEGLKKEIQTLDAADLVIFDVDNTLLIHNDAILRPRGKLLNDRLLQTVLNNERISKKYPEGYLLSQVFSKLNSSLLDPEIVSIIKSLQHRNIKTIAFTAVGTGQLGIIPDMMDWRIKTLKSLDIYFQTAFPHIPSLLFADFKEKLSLPGFKEGILFSALYPKGDVLKVFIQLLNWKPRKILFMDDKMHFLKSVEQAAQELGIDFVGLYYTASYNAPGYLDEKLAEFQFHYLAEQGRWLNDAEARKMLEQKSSMRPQSEFCESQQR